MSFTEALILASLILWVVLGSGLVLAVAVLVPRLIRTLKTLEGISASLERSAAPLLARSDQLLDQSSQIASLVLSNVEAVDDTVARATESIVRMVDLAEERVSDFNALLAVAQEEAEETFFSLAGLVRTVRGVTGKGRRGKRPRRFLSRERRRYG
ncbi:MAG: hypothetical protein ABFS14_00520 [Gemmatimonadota bacterium]